MMPMVTGFDIGPGQQAPITGTAVLIHIAAGCQVFNQTSALKFSVTKPVISILAQIGAHHVRHSHRRINHDQHPSFLDRLQLVS